MSSSPVLPNKADIRSSETEFHRGSDTKFSATKGFLWIMVFTAFWMTALYLFYSVTDKILGR